MTLHQTFGAALLALEGHHGQLVAVDLDALVVLHAVLLAQGGDVDDLLQLLKDGIAGLEG